MAYLVSIASTNLTTNTTWGVVDATSLSDLNTGTTASATAGANSAAFTPGAIVVSHLGVKLGTRVASPTGTVTIELRKANVTVSGASVTVNGSDFNANTVLTHGGWYFVKFASPVTLLAATAYTVFVSSTTASTVSLYRSGTASDWSRMLVTTTNQVPTANDSLIITGNYTAAATSNTITVTQNENGTNIYTQMAVNKNGVLTAAIASNTYLKLGAGTPIDAALTVFNGGSVILGTSGSPINVTNSCIIEFQSTSAGQFGADIKNGGSFATYGATKTQVALLTADAAGGATSITVNSTPTGWKNGDTILLPSTSVTASQSETVALSADVTTTTVSCGATANAHSGTSPTQGEVVIISRNVKIRGLGTTTTTGLFQAEATATVTCYYTEFYQMGANVANKFGVINGLTTTGTFLFNNCSFHDNANTNGAGVYYNSTTGALQLQNCTTYNTLSNNITVANIATSGTNTIDNCISVKTTTATTYGFNIQDTATTLTNCRGISAAASGFLISAAGSMSGTIDNNIAHSNAVNGWTLDTITGGTITNLFSWNNTGVGFSFHPSAGTITLTTGTIFGNTTQGFHVANGIVFGKYTINSYSIHDNTVGVFFSSANMETLIFNSCTFGSNNSTADVQINTANSTIGAYFNNCNFNSTTDFTGQTNISGGDLNPGIMIAYYNQVSTDHRNLFKNGTIASDITLYNTSSPSERLTPNSASSKLRSASKFINLNSGDSVVVGVYARKSTTYNGNQPRLVVKQNYGMGITSDTVLYTSTLATQLWDFLTGTIPSVSTTGVAEVYVDCDGTVGFVNVDDWSVI